MGSSISAIRDQARAAGGDDERTAEDSLNALLTLASLKKDVFDAKIRNDSDRKLIAVDKILLDDYIVQCSVTNDPAQIKRVISSTLGSLAKGAVMDGITSLIGAGLDLVFGSYSANQSEHNFYAITSGSLGGIMRVDVQIFSYQFTSTSLTKFTKNVVCVGYTVSSAEVAGLDKNTLRSIVQTCYGTAVDEATLKSIFVQLVDALKQDKEDKVLVPVM